MTKPMHSLPKPRYWIGGTPLKCDMCSVQIDNAFVDGKTHRGPWAIMCPTCVPKHYIARDGKMATGLGQSYERQPDGRFMKVAG